MYSWIWRRFPGNVWSKLSLSLGLGAAVVALLWYVIFPWATPLLPFDDVQVEAGTGQSDSDPGTTDEGGIPGDEGAPDEIPYSTESNQPHPSPSR